MTPATTAPASYAEGDLVHVRRETAASYVVQPTDGPPTCRLEDLPPLTVCCVPIALVRPADDPDGPMRWVEISDLTPAGDR